MKRSLLLAGVLVASIFSAAWAQTVVTGTVTGEDDGIPVPGVNVIVKGTTAGTVTDIEGRYQINVPSEQSIVVFSFIGLATEEVLVGKQTVIDMVMTADIRQLTEVVVTAIGVAREEKALGYAIQTVKGEDITKAREPNLVNSLQGRVAGAVITNSSGAVGASSRIVLRGASNLGGNNQPLFVVDGVPISNSNIGGTDTEGVNRGNAAADLNPDDIETITVLKGANAAALYGSRASNGVILVTTKKGKGRKDLGISISNTTTFENPLKLPDYQNEYGQGSGGEFEFVDGAGGGTNDGTDESWGPKLNTGLMIPQWNSPVSEAGVRAATPWISYPNNVKDFFETGRTSSTNVALTGGTDRTNFRFSYTYFDQKGMVPNTELKRHNFSVGGTANLTDKLNVEVSGNYYDIGSGNIPGYGYDAQNVMQQFVWFGRQVDIADLAQYTNADGSKRNWNYNYHNNPYFTLNENVNTMDRNRLIGNAKIKYQFTDWLSAFVRVGTDHFSNLNTGRVAADDIDNVYGSYGEARYDFTEVNADFLVSFQKRFMDKLDVGFNVGGNRMTQNSHEVTADADELAVPGVYNVQNSRVALRASNTFKDKQINSLYFFGQIGYNNSLFLDFTGRNDWSSTLPESSNSYFYPSITASAIISDLIGMQSRALSFLKVRASWAQVGSDTDPYSLLPTLEFGDGWNASTKLLNQFVPNNLPNAELKPFIQTSIEVGADFMFVDDRIRLDVTYYDMVNTNQIINIPVSPASGYTSKTINAGKITNKGWEVMVGATILKMSNGFTWDLSMNYARNQNEVVELAEGIERYELGGYWSLDVVAAPGQPYGGLYGYDFLRDPSGNIIHRDGLPAQGDLKILGSYMPDWTGGLINEFSYKGIDLGFLIDIRQGGDLYSMTTTWGRYAGVLEESLKGREGGIVGEGVKEVSNSDGSTAYVPNDVVVTAEQYNKSAYVNDVAYSSIFDASFVKLREIHVGYTFRNIGNTAIKSIGISLVGRNLALLSSTVPHIDPETAFSNTNVQGLEFGQLPSARSLGFNVNITF